MLPMEMGVNFIFFIRKIFSIIKLHVYHMMYGTKYDTNS
jgi:hypothetical protein